MSIPSYSKTQFQAVQTLVKLSTELNQAGTLDGGPRPKSIFLRTIGAETPGTPSFSSLKIERGGWSHPLQLLSRLFNPASYSLVEVDASTNLVAEGSVGYALHTLQRELSQMSGEQISRIFRELGVNEGRLEDIEKCIHYLNRIVDHVEWKKEVQARPNQRMAEAIKQQFTSFKIEVSRLAMPPSLRTKEEARKIFYGLGEEWWKQVIDGEHQEHGKMVFDQGLHRDDREEGAEPGFYASLEDAARFAAEHMCEPVTGSFYKELHKKACAHFQGSANRTEITAAQTGQYRTSSCHTSRINIEEYTKESRAQYGKRSLYSEMHDLWESRETSDKMGWLNDDSYKANPNLPPKYKEALSFIKAWQKKWIEGAEKGNAELQEMTQKLGIKHPLATIDLLFSGRDIFVTTVYSINLDDSNEPLDRQIERVVDWLFLLFNQEIRRPENQSREKKVELIAALYQVLEWLHPFGDGQGRTDLILLAKLLSEHADNPSVLEKPYNSTFFPLSFWVDDLKKGIEAWKKLKK